ncbi:hypothetical protein L7F22_066928 [Adiantum nelumboides]|nr:hypothetical protein [Adiantum nelumboides]
MSKSQLCSSAKETPSIRACTSSAAGNSEVLLMSLIACAGTCCSTAAALDKAARERIKEGQGLRKSGFGPQSQQKDLYDQAIVPIVNEVLEDFNYTIFAYGQIGTGKTYTMESGGRNSRNGELPSEAGVIPRAIKQIFNTLELQNAAYSVKVTFLELYNEETTDLLAPEDISRVMDDKKKALKLDGRWQKRCHCARLGRGNCLNNSELSMPRDGNVQLNTSEAAMSLSHF